MDDTQSNHSWKFPLLRYHTMWSELTAENFQPDRQLDDAYPSYQKGSMLYEAVYEGTDEITPDLWNYTESVDTFSEFSVGYYNRIIELCQSKGIEVVAVTPPKIQDAAVYAANEEKKRAYFEAKEIPYLNYCTYAQVQRLGLTFQEHYYDHSHLNVEGSLVFSKALAHDLLEIFNLEDHRGDEAYAVEWAQPLEEFHRYLEDLSTRRAAQ